jgi:hypothetical protein
MIYNFSEIICLNDYSFFIQKNTHSKPVIKKWHKRNMVIGT